MSKLAPPKTSFKALLTLAGPIFVANIAIIGGGTIDTIMAGQLGKDHLAAVALGLAATVCVIMGLVGILQSLSPIAGHHFGAHQYEKVGEELQQNLWLATVLSFIGVPLLLYTDLWISLGQVQGEVAEMASQFLTITAICLPGSLFGRTFISVFAAISRPRVTMWVSLCMLALKAPLNAVFMYGLFGMPAMGGAGSGVSFGILAILSCLFYFVIWMRSPYCKKVHARKFHGPRWDMIKEQLHVGVPIGLSTFFEVSSFTLMAIFISRFGSGTISAHQIVGNITSMCYMIPLSTGIATSVLVAQCLGAKWPSIAYMVLKRSLITSVVIATVIVTVLLFARQFIVPLYTGDHDVQQLAISLLIFGCCYHVFDALQAVSAFALRGYRVTKLPMIIYGLMLWGVGLGGGYYFAFHGEYFGGPYGVFGFWGCTALGLILTGLSLAAMALLVGRQRSEDDSHSPEEIEAARIASQA